MVVGDGKEKQVSGCGGTLSETVVQTLVFKPQGVSFLLYSSHSVPQFWRWNDGSRKPQIKEISTFAAPSSGYVCRMVAGCTQAYTPTYIPYIMDSFID